MSYGWDPENPLNGREPTIKNLDIHIREAA